MSNTNLSNKFLTYLSLIRFWNPTGYILLFLPCAIGVGLSGTIIDYYELLILFFVGSIVMRSAGCVINDLFDKEIDKKIARTKDRPIAAEKISIRSSLALFICLNIIGLIILFQLSIEARIFGFIAAFLFIIYPLMKRITFWPQLFLGFTYSIGVIIASVHIKNQVTFEALMAYVGCIFWTLYYDTIYAFMDLEDDKKIGVKSLARFLEKKNYKIWLSGFALTALFFIMLGFLLTKHNVSLVIISTLASLAIIMWQITTLQINLSSNCLIRFKSNNYLGIIWALTGLI
jgi:4-hydroxybenzoate polyprenyltransferase